MKTKTFKLTWYNKPIFWLLKIIGIIKTEKPNPEKRTVFIKYKSDWRDEADKKLMDQMSKKFGSNKI